MKTFEITIVYSGLQGTPSANLPTEKEVVTVTASSEISAASLAMRKNKIAACGRLVAFYNSDGERIIASSR